MVAMLDISVPSPKATPVLIKRFPGTLKALISPGSTMNPREMAVLLEAPSPNQSKSFKKKPFGMPTREMRVVGFLPFPATAPISVSQASMKESIIDSE